MTKGKGKNPGASGLSKHLKRKEHKERSQPASRLHLGQLEKHKDHVLRARKRKVKVKRLQEIKRAAAQRNPDEYHMGMTKAVMDIATGKYKRKRAAQTPEERAADIRKSMVSSARNLQYLEYKANADKARSRELLAEDAAAALTATKPVNKHIVFADDEEDFRHFSAERFFDATPEMLRTQHPATRGRLAVLRETVLPEEVLLSGGHHMKSVAQRRRERREMHERLARRGLTTGPSAAAAAAEQGEGGRGSSSSPSQHGGGASRLGPRLEGESEEEWKARERARILGKAKEKRELKRYRFAEMVLQDAEERRRARAEARAQAEADGEYEAEEEDPEASMDHVDQVLAMRRRQEAEAAALSARRAKEITQRMERSRSLGALAQNVRFQIGGMKKQLDQKTNSRFKPTARRRAR